MQHSSLRLWCSTQMSCLVRADLQQVAHSGRGGGGAWAPWSLTPTSSSANLCQHVDPRQFKAGRLRLQLGRSITLHFVATDFMGCPAVLSKEQRLALWAGGVQLLPRNGEAMTVIATFIINMVHEQGLHAHRL